MEIKSGSLSIVLRVLYNCIPGIYLLLSLPATPSEWHPHIFGDHLLEISVRSFPQGCKG